MKITFLGQAGFLIESNNKTILIDPYLSNNVAKYEPQNVRRQPIDIKYLNLKPDYILITHCHLDHYDKETLKHYFNSDKKIVFLCPLSVYEDIKSFGRDDYILIKENDIYVDNNIKVLGVKAFHSDPYALGYILTIENKRLYFTGDTLFNRHILENVNIKNVDFLAVPINGVGNNMNVKEAIEFANQINPKFAMPIHYGMFDEINPQLFTYKTRLILSIYHSITL